MAIESGASTHPLRGEVLLLLRVAMAVFVWTIVIGMLNGSDLVDFDQKVILSHVHAGTLGWVTTCVFAASLWLFGESATDGQLRTARALARVAVVTLPVFAFTFALTYGNARAILGSFALATIVGFFGWVLARAGSVVLTTVHLGFLAAVTTSVVGGVLGVLLATKIATGRNVIPSGGEDAHPGTMVIGFLIPVGMALAEWGLRGSSLEPAGRRGRLQIGLPFLGGMLLMVGLLTGIDPLTVLAAVIELVGIIIFLVRMMPSIRQVRWGERAPNRFAAASALAIVANIVFINYLAAANAGDFDKVPERQLLALDHTMFIGVLTNAIFAMLVLATPRAPRPRDPDTLVFVGLNLGLAGFVVSFLANSVWLERIATPLLGAAILVGLVEHSVGLLSGARTTTPTVSVVPTTSAPATG